MNSIILRFSVQVKGMTLDRCILKNLQKHQPKTAGVVHKNYVFDNNKTQYIVAQKQAF